MRFLKEFFKFIINLFCSLNFKINTYVKPTRLFNNQPLGSFFFKVGEYYKPLKLQVNGSITQRDQRLLGVTCCRKNADPKYFMLATTLSLWIDVYPSVQFEWDNITGNTFLVLT